MLSLRHSIGDRDLESVYGHVHHAQALFFLERARLELLERIDHSSAALIASDLYPVVYRLEVTYKREIFADAVEVTCESGRIAGKSFFIGQRILNSKGKECLCAEVECKLMQGSTKRAVVPPPGFARAFLEFFRCSSST